MDMTPIAISIIFTVIVFTIYPPSFTFTKILKVEDQPPINPKLNLKEPLTEDELKQMYKDAPPTLDDLVEGINEILFNIEGDE